MILHKMFLLLFIVILLPACAFNPATGELDVVTMSEKKEIAIGKKMHDELVKNNALYNEANVRAYIQSVGDKLALHSHRPDLRYHFSLIDSPGVNAFALPGGYIYLNRGLLAFLENEEQLAAVLAHELGHITARHAVKQKTASTAMTALSVIALLGTGSGQLAQATHKGGAALVSGYGREHELEADRLGAEYLHNAGYNKNALLDVIGILKTQELYARNKANAQGRKLQTYHGLFATHPRNDRRLQNIIANTQSLNAPTPQLVDPAHFREAVDGLPYGNSVSSNAATKNRFFHKKLNFTFAHPEGWQIESNAKYILAANKDKLGAIKLELKKPKGKLSPREFLNQELSIDTLHRSEALSQYGLLGHTGIQPAQANHKTQRVAVFFYQNLAFLLTGELSNKKYDKAYLTIINSFRPMRRSERKPEKPLQIKYKKIDVDISFAVLARSSKVRRNTEDQLRLLNNQYPKGEPKKGDWIKVVE